MNDINKVLIIGRMTRDIGERDFGYITTGTARLNISIAVNEIRKGQNGWTDYPNYFDVTIWGKTAENLKPYLTKGKQVAIEGHLQQQRWESNGQRNSKVVIIADNVELCGGREGNGQSAPAPQQSAPQQYAPQNNAQEYAQPTLGDEFPEDIPF